MEYDTGDYCFFNLTEPKNPVILTLCLSDGKYSLKQGLNLKQWLYRIK
jgi:hypothetical protein